MRMMKKLSTLLLLSLSAMFIFSCQKAESPVTTPTEGTITTLTVAAPGSDVDTKVSFVDEEATGMKLTWEENDVITIYSADGNTIVGNYECTSVDSETGNATFTKDGSATALVSGITYQAVYPASDKNTITDRDAAMATTLADQKQTAAGLAHLDSYLFMKDASFVAGTDNLAFDYEVSTYVLEFPWSGTAPTSVEFKDVKIDGATRTPITYKLSKSDGFAINLGIVKIYFMIAANNPAEYRGVSFTIENGTPANKKVFTTPATAIAYAAGKTYRGTISAVSDYDEATDYIDEYGANHGQGTAVGGSTLKWAPVNCGYQQAIAGGHKGYPYGKLYQWGRKDGQGYKGGSYEDAIVPAIVGSTSDTPEANKFYEGWTTAPSWDTANDPCPSGWRVPTADELRALISGNRNPGSFNTKDGQDGYYFDGTASSNATSGVFFPAAGCRGYEGNAYVRGSDGYYWSSTPNGDNAYSLGFGSGYAGVYSNYRTDGYSVRCVQD